MPDDDSMRWRGRMGRRVADEYMLEKKRGMGGDREDKEYLQGQTVGGPNQVAHPKPLESSAG